LSFLRLIGQLENHFAGARQAHLFASDSFDGLGIGAQRLDLFVEVAIFLIEPVEFAAQLFHLRLRATHGQQTVVAENVVHGQKQEPKPENQARMAAPK